MGVVAILWAFAQNGYAQAPASIGPNLNLTKAAGNQYETAVAIDPNDNNQIFIASRNEIGGLYTALSLDGGIAWTSKVFGASAIPQPGDIPRAYGNASVAWDTFGNIFIAYLSQGRVNSPAIYVTLVLSTDGGLTFHSPTGTGFSIYFPVNGPIYYVGDQPTVTVGPGSGGTGSSVWLTYWSFGGMDVSGAAVTGLGAVGAFQTQSLPAQPAAVNFGDIAIGPNGEVMVTYGPNSGSSGTLYSQVDPDGLGPAGFSSPAAIANVNIGGFTYIPAQPNWGIDPEVGLAYDRTTGPHRGRVYAVYTDAPAVGSTDTNIFVVHSDDQGTTWSAPVRVNDDTGVASQFLPRISLDQSTGMVAVTWYDARNSAANETAQYFGAFSADYGATFGPNFQIGAGTSNQANSVAALKKADYGDYTGNAFFNGRLVPAWADNSNSTGDNPDGATNFEVYTAIVEAPAMAPPDFSLAAAPSSEIVYPGQSTTYTVTLTPLNGFSAAVTYGVAGLPSGALGTFNGTVLTVAASSATPAGTYPLTIAGTSGTLSHTAMISLVVEDFIIAATPSSQTVLPGFSAAYNVALTPLNGFNGAVTYGVTGLPMGATGTFNGTVLTVAASSATPPGTYSLTITGTSGALSHTASVQFTVIAGFTLSARPAARTCERGDDVVYKIAVNDLGGFKGAVVFSIAGLPANVRANFWPKSSATFAWLDVAVFHRAVPGTYTLTVTGTSGALTQSVPIALTVK